LLSLLRLHARTALLSCRAVEAEELAPELCKFVKRREYRRDGGDSWRLCRAYGVKKQGKKQARTLCTRCVKLHCAATAKLIDAEPTGDYRAGQCTAHGQEGVKQHGVAEVQDKLTALGYNGTFLLEVNSWTLLKTLNKVEGHARSGQFKAGPDIRVDMLVTDDQGQLLGIEVNGREHRTAKQLDADLRKTERAPFPILWLCDRDRREWDEQIAAAWRGVPVTLPEILLARRPAVEASAPAGACRAPSPTPPCAAPE
jgi:hypothetical protein